MCRNFKNIISVVCLVLISFSSSAFATPPSWGPLEKITSIEVGAGAAYFSSPSYNACGSSTGQTMLSFNTENAKEIYAAVLAAYTSGKPVKLYTDGCIGPYYNVLRASY